MGGGLAPVGLENATLMLWLLRRVRGKESADNDQNVPDRSFSPGGKNPRLFVRRVPSSAKPSRRFTIARVLATLGAFPTLTIIDSRVWFAAMFLTRNTTTSCNKTYQYLI